MNENVGVVVYKIGDDPGTLYAEFCHTWDGRGMDVETTNGGLTMYVPDGYNARLETGTVNGGIDLDFPITIQGRMTRRNITTELGDGGPLIRAPTTNGGVRIRRI